MGGQKLFHKNRYYFLAVVTPTQVRRAKKPITRRDRLRRAEKPTWLRRAEKPTWLRRAEKPVG